MRKLINKYLFEFRNRFWVVISIIALKFNSYKLFALVILINIKKLKNIKSYNKNTKKILIFSKSGGTEDIIQSIKSHKNIDINFYMLRRSFFKQAHKHFFKNFSKTDYFTKIKNNHEFLMKKKFIKFLTDAFNFLNKFIQIDAFISFNLFYYAEKYLDEVFINLNRKFIIIQKESVLSPNGEKLWTDIYSRFNDKSLASKIIVYSNNQKKNLIKSKIALKKQIILSGCPRSDYSFNLQKIRTNKKIIVFFLINTKIYSKANLKKKLELNNMNHKNVSQIFKDVHNWNKLFNQTISYLSEYAKKNLDTKVILKGKTGVHFKKSIKKYLSKNCIFIEQDTGAKYLKDARVVISFNSTITLEAIAANRNLIIPNFNNENIKNKDDILQINNNNHYVNSKNQFFKKLNYYLRTSHHKKKITSADKKALNYYLGNTDGSSSKRLIGILSKEINKN